MKVRNMTLCGIFAAVLCMCAWLSFPLGDMAITLQTFGVFLCLGILGGKRGTISILVYLLLGAVGLPVFSGFRGGIGTLLNTTGGYLTGFLACSLVYWLLTSLFPRHTLLAMLAGLLICYLFGSFWYYRFYLAAGGSGNIVVVLLQNLLFLPADILKLILAQYLSKRILTKISP